MRLLFLGDVMGRSGRAAVSEHLQRLRAEWRLDFVVVNGENATNGMGLSGDHAKALFDAAQRKMSGHVSDKVVNKVVRVLKSNAKVVMNKNKNNNKNDNNKNIVEAPKMTPAGIKKAKQQARGNQLRAAAREAAVNRRSMAEVASSSFTPGERQKAQDLDPSLKPPPPGFHQSFLLLKKDNNSVLCST